MNETHDRLVELTPVYVLGALNDEDRLNFEAHAATCASCQAEVTRLRAVAVVLSQATATVGDNPVHGIVSRAPAMRRNRPWRFWRRDR